MQSRKSDPIGYFFNNLRYKYDLIVSAYKKNNRTLVSERVSALSDYIKEYAPYYGITAPEVKQYFVTNKMSLNFKF
jgi:uncharacterized protein YutD